MYAKSNFISQKQGAPHAAFFVLLAATATSSAACPAYAQVTETVLYNFTGGKDGANPGAPLRADTTGPGGALRGLYGQRCLGRTARSSS
jgi:hypothetical protein